MKSLPYGWFTSQVQIKSVPSVSHFNSISCWLLCPISALVSLCLLSRPVQRCLSSVCSYTLLYYKCLTGCPGTHAAAGFVQRLILLTVKPQHRVICQPCQNTTTQLCPVSIYKPWTVLRPYLLMGHQVISLARSRLGPLKAAALGFWSLNSALWLTACSLLDSGRVCDCSARPPGSNGNIPWEEFASGVSWSAVINTLYSKNSSVPVILHNGFCKGQNSLWIKAFLLSVSVGKSTLSQALVLLTFSQVKTFTECLHLSAVCPVHCVPWGYMSVEARTDLAKAQQHLRQWTNPGLSRSETQRAGLRAYGLWPPPAASLLLLCWQPILYGASTPRRSHLKSMTS